LHNDSPINFGELKSNRPETARTLRVIGG